MTDFANGVVEREIRIEAQPETIFPFFTEPDLMIRWMGGTAQTDPRPGGHYRLAINDQRVASGTFVEVSPHERVVFTWGWELGASPVQPGTSTVTITLTPDGNHTVVRLVHSDLPTEGAAEAHAKGWDHYLARLIVAATGGDPGADRWTETTDN